MTTAVRATGQVPATAPARASQGRNAAAWRLLTKRYIRRYSRQPAVLVLAVLQPVMFILLFRFVFGGAITVPGGNYIEFLMPGVIGLTMAFASMGTAVALAEDITVGLVNRLRSMPIPRSAVLIGRLVWDVLEYSAVIAMMLAVGYAVGFRFLNGFVPAVGMCLLALVFAISMSCVSAFVGMTVRKPEAVASFGLIWLFPLCFISSAFVPTATMPAWLQPIANANPVSVVIEAMRAMALGGPIAVHLVEALAWIVAIFAVFIPLAVRAYRRAV